MKKRRVKRYRSVQKKAEKEAAPPKLTGQQSMTTTELFKLTAKFGQAAFKSFWRLNRFQSRTILFLLVGIIVFSIVRDIYEPKRRVDAYRLDGLSALVDADRIIPVYESELRVEQETGTINFNQGYRPGGEVGGDSVSPKVSASFEGGDSNKVTLVDPITSVAIGFTPQFDVDQPLKNGDKVVYPLFGEDAVKVYTVQGSGIKQDIILRDRPADDAMSFAYDVDIPAGVELRLEQDGSIGGYSIDSVLLGDVQTVNAEDAALLESARENGEKTKLLFKLPAPYVVGPDGELSKVKSWYELDNNVLTLHAEGLREAEYPLSIDPTIYIETAQKLMRGNNETNIDFDVTNELIQKSQSTGARIDSWQTNLDISESVWGHSSATAGGYIYRAGGRTEDGSTTQIPLVESTTESLQNSNSTSFVMNMPGTRPAGDLYIAIMCHDGTGAVTPPSGGGWTEYADTREHAAYYKVGTDEGGGDEAASYTWTGSNEKWGGVIMRVTGFDTTTPVSPTPTTNSSGSNSSTPTAPAITPDNASTLIIRSYGIDNDEIGDSGWAPTGHTSLGFGGSTGSNDCAYGAASMDSPPAATVSTGTANMQSGYVNDTYGSSTIAVNPTPPSGSTPTTVDTVEWAEFNSSTLQIESPTPSNTGAACSGWCTETDYHLPEERRNHSMIAYNGYLYVIGGQDDSDNIESTVFIAKLGANGEPALWHPTDNDPSNWDFWYTDTALSSARQYTSIAVYNNRMYLVGGQTTAGSAGVTTVEKADILPNGRLGSWTTTGMQALPAGAGTMMADVQVYNDTLYTIGGFEGVPTSDANMRNATYYSKLDDDGDMNAWQSTSSFTTARVNHGGIFSYIWGAYIYMGGGCDSVDGSGYCTSFSSDMQLASINADGSLGSWRSIGALDNTRIGYSFIGWQGGLYRIGGCVSVETSAGECTSALADVDYGVINSAGELSTVSEADELDEGTCDGATPYDCDLPALGDGAGQGGHMLNASIILNGFIYVIGGCTDTACAGSSGNISYASVGTDGRLEQPADCVASGNTYANNGTQDSSWCVDSTNRANGTAGISAPGIALFNNRIYLVGGIDDTADGVTAINHNAVNSDGSLDGAWETDTFASVGITGEKAYTYAYARANPAAASTAPGNLYVIGGCSAISASVGCSSSYNTEVYKCNIAPDGTVSSCSTSGQLQLDVELADETDQGLGLHSGTVYANYIYLIGGFSDNVGDRDTIFYARFDDSNNIVDPDSGLATGDANDWTESSETLSVGRRRGSAFGYNGHIYAVGGYDDTGTGIIPFIEWAKEDVSDGSLEPFVTSSVEIRQRWGLTMAVSNSYAYVIGGCDDGPSPSPCNSMEPSVQTFQLYNNDSGTPASWDASGNQFGTDRYGGSSVIHNGYIYHAGGCVDAVGDCSTTTNNVQYAALDAEGDVGTWSSTSMNLPDGRGWGQLEEAGGTLYWVGGQDNSGDEKSEVYYSTPETSGSAQDVFRVTTYEIETNEFTGTTYTLNLNNDLSEQYFTMITGSDENNADNEPDDSSVAVSQDPYGNFASSTSNDDEIQLTRGDNISANAGGAVDWVGTVTVVECLRACGTSGFQLKEVVHHSLPAGNGNTLQTPGSTSCSSGECTATLSEDYTANTVPFGGRYGGGAVSTNNDEDDFSVELGVRIFKENNNELTFERYGASGRTPGALDVEVYVVEWGSEWTVQEANFVDWTTGGGGADGSGEYTTASISSVNTADTWLWKSPGTSQDDGLGDGAFGKVLTMGDGTSPVPTPTTTTLAIGSEQNGDVRRDTAYAMTHSSLDVDHVFVTDNSSATSETTTIASANGTESYDNVSTSVRYTEGYRIPFLLGTESGTGNAFARAGGWYPRITADTTLTYQKSYSGNAHAAWTNIADFASITYTPTAGDLALWETASNGLPADRTQFGAASWNDRIYVVGGLDDAGADTNNIYISPDLSSGGDIGSAWTNETTNTPDVARSGNTVLAYANNLYSIGGYDGSNYLLDVQFTQIETDGTIDDAWTFTTPLPNPTRQGDSFAANGYMYVVGGRSSDSVCDSHTYVAPISANTTIATGNNPTGVGEWNETNERYTGDRFGNAVSYNQGRMYVLGGGCITTPSTVFDATGSDTYTIPGGVTSITVKMWGAGGGGGGDGSSGIGGSGGGGAYVEGTLSVTPSDIYNVYVGAAGTGGSESGNSGAGGGGGGRSQIDRSGTDYFVAAGGGGGGGGDNSSSVAGGAGGGGGVTNGEAGGDSDNSGGLGAGGGAGATSGAGGAGGADDSANDGSAGAFESGGDGADGRSVQGVDGSENNGGAADGGDGGQEEITAGYAGGGGGGGGRYGGGGGGGSEASNAGGGGGGGGSSHLDGSVTSTGNSEDATGSTPGNAADVDRASAGSGGGNTSAGADGRIVIIEGGNVMTLTGSNRTSVTTLLSQPQLAKYSRMIDTDSDVFPNSWLINGLDNSIGARWQVRYRSMHDLDAEVNPAEDCGTSLTMPQMTTWGQDTDFGDTTLGDVNPYIALNGSGGDINCARYFYFFVEIDAEQTFGYPEDVNRGPTMTDLSLFFTSDPNKRLRHGKTFTGGEQQPLDTPCRQSVDLDCPLP